MRSSIPIDRILTCRACGVRFVYSGAEQRERHDLGLSAPTHCPGCVALERLDCERQGAVIWFDARRGYGFVRSDSGDQCFVHASAVSSRRALRRGERISFRLEPSDRGLRAVEVRLLDKADEP